MSTFLAAAVATLVFCAPGSPGGAGDAQPYVDQFATAAASGAGWPAGSLAAIYDPTESGGITKLGNPDSVLAFVPYAFFVQHATELHLTPIAQADLINVGTEERWNLVGKAGGAADGAALAGYTLVSVAAYAPQFIRGVALAGWALPADLKMESSGQVLSALRRVVAGEKVVVLLDQTQSAALPTLPFAAQLKTLTQSPPVPVAVLAVVNSRVNSARSQAFQAALIKLGGSDTLRALHLKGFVLPKLPPLPTTP